MGYLGAAASGGDERSFDGDDASLSPGFTPDSVRSLSSSCGASLSAFGVGGAPPVARVGGDGSSSWCTPPPRKEASHRCISEIS